MHFMVSVSMSLRLDYVFRNYNARLISQATVDVFIVLLFAIVVECCCHFGYEKKKIRVFIVAEC